MSNRLMPRRPDRLALAAKAAQVKHLLRNKFQKDEIGSAADLIFVDKNRRGRRPISEMGLPDRVLFRALVSLIATAMPKNIVNRMPNEDFRKWPLSVEGARYVSKTDVTSYYEYVDHGLLGSELEAQTGEAPAIDALMSLLERVMGRKMGLPQVHKSSDILGDVYIDVVRRKLLRAGFDVVTFSDDFRIATPSLSQARRALESCAREVRSLGLTLNESKTFTYTRGNYQASLDAFTIAEERLFDTDGDADNVARLLFAEGYTDETTADTETARTLSAASPRAVAEEDVLETTDVSSPADVEPQQVIAAKRAWQVWDAERRLEETQPTRDAAITESLLARALPILGRSGFREPLRELSLLLRSEPALSPQICEYIIELGNTGPSARTAIRRTLDELVVERSFSTWQKVWIAEAAGTIRAARNHHSHYDWLEKCVRESEASLAATSAAALGRLGRISSEIVTPALDRVGPEWRSLVFWAIAVDDADLAREVAEDRLERLILQAVTS
ncbi:hypothetical protein MTE01_17430 [Microbacterium testaceum]|uniref:Reverse transcriptase domain-containing protein n=2 Tax=Microbacterium testaceum TaxID=2033 RepID=A0A4Y3QMS7_MICTE|nr:hypothetical protein MTE01_17430 [Microbacterium testaceum]